jgi:hypothetical protein
MIWMAVGAAAVAGSHMVVFPGAMHGFLTYTNEVQRIRAGGGGTSTVGSEPPTKAQMMSGAQGGGAAEFEDQLAMQKAGIKSHTSTARDSVSKAPTKAQVTPASISFAASAWAVCMPAHRQRFTARDKAGSIVSAGSSKPVHAECVA